eukprot:1454602-Rhodomonas_salina.4
MGRCAHLAESNLEARGRCRVVPVNKVADCANSRRSCHGWDLDPGQRSHALRGLMWCVLCQVRVRHNQSSGSWIRGHHLHRG